MKGSVFLSEFTSVDDSLKNVSPIFVATCYELSISVKYVFFFSKKYKRETPQRHAGQPRH